MFSVDLFFLFFGFLFLGFLLLCFFFLLLFLLLFLFLFLLLFFLFVLFRLFGLLGCGFGDLIHADHEVSVLDAYFFYGIVAVEGFALEDHLEGLSGHAFDFLNFVFEDRHLHK